MATSSRQAALFGVQDWQRIYQTYRQANFQSYDFETLRKSFIDYLTTYYPETFNDYTESSEFIALLDIIAFMGQSMAFRDDLNARENFIDTAERRDSVIKLANLVSYTPKRNNAGQGLIKVTSISTTENVLDINGVNLNNSTIIWNDPANSYWQEQFNAIINAALINSQRIGRPGNTQDILGVKTEQYSFNLPLTQSPTLPFSTIVDGNPMNFEVVSSSTVGSSSIYEPPPAPNGQLNILYRNDKLGYGSPNTGFFFYFKQGTLQAFNFSFLEAIQNNFQQINIEGINQTDTWMYGLDATGQIMDQWVQTDNIYVNANPQGNSNRKIFSVYSRTNDQVTYQFGDGVFGEIPVGNFRAYIRSSNGLTYTIDPSEMQGVSVSMPNISLYVTTELLTFTMSLQTYSSTALQREPLATIKERAPSRYYTQNRMVNGEDYTNFPFTYYNNIIKSKALNRSSIGVSRSLDLLDPSGKYSSLNVFADDGALYDNQIPTSNIFSAATSNSSIEYLSQNLPALLEAPSSIQYYFSNYQRYTGYYSGGEAIDHRCYWKRVSTTSDSVTGYFYVSTVSGEQPIIIGTNSSYSMKYITAGAHLKFVPPPGYHFDKNNRIVQGPANLSIGDKTYIWVGVTNVVGDGTSGGSGSVRTGVGAVTLNTYVPSAAFLETTVTNQDLLYGTAIIPVFDNTIGNDLQQRILNKIALRQNFALQFDNSLPISKQRWSIIDNIPTNPNTYFVSFTASSINSNYTVEVKATNYYFGSVEEVRFYTYTSQRVFDQKSGQFLSDFVNVLKTNSTPDTGTVLGTDYKLNITGQAVESDGYPNDFSVSISTINQNTGFSFDPDFFNILVGSGLNNYVFFQKVTDGNNSAKTQILPDGLVWYGYATKAAISTNAYEFPIGQIFYATGENAFYQSYQVAGTATVVIDLTDVSNQYTVDTGRGALQFQYRHNSGDTTRIDPGTTNIIDLYLVTQAYYAAYKNWINDSTGTVLKPSEPTINELEQAYGDLNSYKMISDSVIMNSVVFKPLFGTKAATALQGTIKIIKSNTTTVSDSQIRTSALTAMNNYFSIDNWDFGQTFYMSELTAYLHSELGSLISSVVLVPNDPNQTFGDLYEIRSAPYEIFVNGATANDIVIISALTPKALQR